MYGHSDFYGHHGHGACCYQPGGFRGHPFHRHFTSREEYLKDQQAEAKVMEKHLADIKATGYRQNHFESSLYRSLRLRDGYQ